MAHEAFTLAGHQAVSHGCGLAIAQLQRSPPGAERQQTGHGMGFAQGIQQLLAEQEQAAAFRIDGQARCRGMPEVVLAAPSGGQFGGMQLGVTPGRITPRQPWGRG